MAGLGTALANINLASGCPRSARYVKTTKAFGYPGIYIPDFFTCSSIYSDQTTIECADINFAFVHGCAPIMGGTTTG